MTQQQLIAIMAAILYASPVTAEDFDTPEHCVRTAKTILQTVDAV